MTVWTVYRNPSDFPRRWVLRAIDVGPDGPLPRPTCFVADTLQGVRAGLPPGLWRLPRQPGDDPAIYETWV